MTIALLGGCSFAPPYHIPITETPVAYKEAAQPSSASVDLWKAAQPGVLDPKEDWWHVYGDTTLDALEARVAKANPTLAGALARYEQANAYLAQARSGLFPHIGIDADVTRNRQSDNRPLRGANQPDIYSADTLGGDVAYDLDLWGRVRNSVAAGRAEAAASQDDLAAITLSLESQLAVDYVTLRGQDRQIALLTATVDDFAKADAMTRRRFQGGIISGVDVGRSGAQLGEAQAQLADLEAARALTEHAIASLVGTPASDFSLPVASADFTIPETPTGLPSTLLQRRPDVAAAERRMAAANAEIGIAKAAFFPSLSLGGSGGVQNTGLADLLTAPNIFWSIGPSAVLNLIDGGRRRAQLAAARAIWSETTAAYRARVLQAFQDVEDQLALLRHLGEEQAAEDRAVAQASQAEEISLNRYVKGAAIYLDVVTAQTTALRVRQTALALETRRVEASIGLIRALGGGWHDPSTIAVRDTHQG